MGCALLGLQLNIVRSHVEHVADGILRPLANAGNKAVDVAKELYDEGRNRTVIDRLRIALLLDSGVVHDDDLVGQFERLLLVVC
ncbi:hypothetical protein RZS08_46020, partial [Arthrospira platensis SPKY1]|nr:hypothetical protein [Arthrospira platensis SPKY1]